MRTIMYFATLLFLGNSCMNTDRPESTASTSSPSGAIVIPADPVYQGTAFATSTKVFYQAKLKPVSSVDQVISLWLTPAFEAKMTVNYLGVRPNVLTSGTWKTLENGNLFLLLSRVGEKDSTMLEFKPDGDKIVYVKGNFGVEGLTMFAAPEPPVL